LESTTKKQLITPAFSPLTPQVCNPTKKNQLFGNVPWDDSPPQVTLLLMNSIANEALPLFLDQIVPSGGLRGKPPRKRCSGVPNTHESLQRFFPGDMK